MFTGIVEEVGVVNSIFKKENSVEIEISGNKIFEDLKLGDSVSTNGVCLTVKKINGKKFVADIMNETIKRTNLKSLRTKSFVNLERALRLDSRLGGHIVSGHIDGLGKIKNIYSDGIAFIYNIELANEMTRYIVEKGSITIDGVSLTVTSVGESFFEVSLIPHTLKETVLGHKKMGDYVNLEVDIIGKYIEKLLLKKPSDQVELENKEGSNKITMDYLIENGFLQD